MPTELRTLLEQANSLRFKLLAIIGKDEAKKQKIISTLQKEKWNLVDVGSELLEIHSKLESENDNELKIGEEIKEWFNEKPNNLILVNASILYHSMFMKISPVGAFKYNSRNKNCVIFLEDEEKLGSRIYHGQAGKEDYYDQEINDIVTIQIDEVFAETTGDIEEYSADSYNDPEDLPEGAIGRLINFSPIKDVIDIDTDLKGIDRRKELVSSYVISESLQSQIGDFFDNISKPNHKAITVIGNYGSGKSHLIGFLVSIIEAPEIAKEIQNEKIRNKAAAFSRKYFTVQFELQSGQVSLNRWFYAKIRQQLKNKFDITIPEFDLNKDFDDKENIARIIDIIKQKEPSSGLLVVIDEISDFLSAKQVPQMRADLQFLRVLGQVCQDQDLMFIGSMQEDVFTSPKFKDVAEAIGRVEERFQYIYIHKEDIKKVLSQRIVNKTELQKHELEKLFTPWVQKIEGVGRNIDEYIDLFPMTPFILELFSDLPYFEKRGVLQFAMSEIKHILHKRFPVFITFDKIYDILELNPNKKNLEEVFEISKVIQILKQKINLLESKYVNDALKIIKGLAVYSLWNKKERGATAQELANNLMVLPENKKFTAADNIGLIIKKIREVTDGEYIKVEKDETTNITCFRFETKTGVDPEQKIAQKAAVVSDTEIEDEIFRQLREIIGLEPVSGHSDLFEDECKWQSVKSFRSGYVLFTRKFLKEPRSEQRDFVVEFVSPFAKSVADSLAKHKLTIQLVLEGAENIEIIKEIVAIRSLISNNFMKPVMTKKLEGRINGYEIGRTQISGLKYRLSKLLLNYAVCSLDSEKKSIKAILGRERANIPEIFDELKTALFDKPFNDDYPQHLRYSIQLSSRNIEVSLSALVADLSRGDFTTLNRSTRQFLQSIQMLDTNDFPDTSKSPVIHKIYDTLKGNGKKVTDIQKELVDPLKMSAYGLEPQMVHFLLALLTIQGKTFLQAKGGNRIDINNIRDKLKTLSVFETISYARLHEDFSYDFASRLITTLGLHGQKITLEKERLNAFKEYKERVAEILQKIASLESDIQNLQEKQKLFINIDAVNDALVRIKKIDWKSLDIANHTQFSQLEKLNNSLPELKLVLAEINELHLALQEYINEIHLDILYMEDANRLIADNPILSIDNEKISALIQFESEVKTICGQYDTFTDRAQRNPVKGKIQQFKKIYRYDIYIPSHEKFVGKNCNWKILDTYNNLRSFKKISLLNKVNCISETAFLQKIDSWTKLKKFKCDNSSLADNLAGAVRCPQCLFPQEYTYTRIKPALDSIEQNLDAMLSQYEKIIVKEIREYRDNLKFLEENEKCEIEYILKNEKLPDSFTNTIVTALNKLFREIDVVELNSTQLVKSLFPEDEFITVAQLRERFLNFENDLVKGKQENEVRIRLKQDFDL